MRLTVYLPLAVFTFFLLFTLTDCHGPDADGLYVIPLTDSLRTSGTSNYQRYYAVRDTARWEETLAAADTITVLAGHGLKTYEKEADMAVEGRTTPREGEVLKFRSGGIWYVARMINGELRANQQYPGWERRIDSVARTKNIVRLLDNERVVVDIPSAQVVLGTDSVTIGLMRVTGRAFDWQDFPLSHPDYLVLLPKGEEVAYVAMDSDNIGPVGRQTVFRVGRRYYVLRSVADDYGSITVEEMPAARGMELTAELDTYYQRIPVKDLYGKPTSIPHRSGQDMALYFFFLGGPVPEYVLTIDSLYRELPPARREELDIALVSRFDLTDSLKSFVGRYDLQLPVYQSTEKTCRRLNCTAFLPNFVGVDERGRIVTFHGRHRRLEERLRSMLNSPANTRTRSSRSGSRTGSGL